MAKYIIYSTPTCTYCVSAKKLLEAHMLPYETRDISTDDEAFEHYLTFKKTTVPQITYEGELIGGFTDLKEKLNG